MIVNILLGFIVIFFFLIVGAIVWVIWFCYKIIDCCIFVIGGWMGKDCIDIVYGEVVKMIKMFRGIGFWGDIVVIFNDCFWLELWAMFNFWEVYDYMVEWVVDKIGCFLEVII